METVKRIIFIAENKIYLNPTLSFRVNDTNHSVFGECSGEQSPIFWEGQLYLFFLLRKSDIFEMFALDIGNSVSPIKTDFELMR